MTANQTIFAAIPHENVVMVVVVGLISVTLSTSVIDGDRRQIRAQLHAMRQNEQRARALLDAIPDQVFRFSSEGIMLEARGSTVDVLAPPDDLVGKPIHAHPTLTGVPPELIENAWPYAAKALREGCLQVFEYQLRYPGRGLQDFEARVVPSAANEILVMIRNVTERKSAERCQRELTAELQAANQELNNFAYIVSHDLRAPLRGIHAVAEWLSHDHGDQLGESGRRLLDLLQQRVTRMDMMIQGVLEMSRLGQEGQRASVELQPLVTGIIDDLAVDTPHRITLDTPLPVVHADPTRMRQVFQNLLDNAVKYLNQPVGEIHVGCQRRADGWLFCVRDNGPGIAPEHSERIFQLFETLQPREQVESTGIGLAIVKRIVETYGGKVWVESTLGVGSAFFFTLPSAEEPDDSAILPS
ncbi:MAG: GHKL domain-containing protein [Anaerolineae bacterium]|nr:GHKL domain-containing protein [Anaerolineae bacterium]